MSIFKKIKNWFIKKQQPSVTKAKTNAEDLKRKLQIKHHKLILNPNDFLDNQIVLYFERTNHPIINDYISKNHKKLQQSFREKGLKFIHIPSTDDFRGFTDSKKELIQYLNYKHPHIFNESEQEASELLDSVISDIDIQLYNSNLGDLLGIPSDQGPCFIHSVDSVTQNNEYRKWEYSCFLLNTTDVLLITKQIEFYLAHTGIPSDQIYFSLKKEDKLNYDADERFEFDGSKISPEINKAIQQINNITNEKLLITSMLYLIESLKKSNPLICEKISQSLLKRIETASAEPSRLIVDEKFRIWLPDYNNIEIEMTPLPKAFYIFMLKHPEGISFKHLSEYKTEIMDIYSCIANRYDMDKIKQSINDIADIRSNSVNEKCSRIKEAFISKFDDSIAKNYYITGGRNELKRVQLNSSLIQLPKNL